LLHKLSIILVLLFISCGGRSVTPELFDLNTPGNLSGKVLTPNEVVLTWNDLSHNEAGYVIEKKFEHDSYIVVAEISRNSNKYIVSNLIEHADYKFRVASYKNGKQSPWSEIELNTHLTLDELAFGDDENFDIATWNIEAFPKNSDITVAYASQIITNLNLDIIGLQEIKSDYQFQVLLTQLDGYIGVKTNSAAYDVNTAYIYNSSTVEDVIVYEIFEDDYIAFPRNPYIMECKYRGIELVIINLHLKCCGDGEIGIDPWDEENRREVASLKLEQYILDNFSNKKVIILGDWNDEITDDESTNVFWNFIENDSEYYFTDTPVALGDSASWSYPSWPSHLDHILMNNNVIPDFPEDKIHVSTIRLDYYFRNRFYEYNENVSDHLPVCMKLLLE
jgi:endonuclease/exonuclease/phosphatase family metal-dependent hydrolase